MITARLWAAKLRSVRSTKSSCFNPTCCKTLGMAFTGPIPMISGERRRRNTRETANGSKIESFESRFARDHYGARTIGHLGLSRPLLIHGLRIQA